MLKIIFALTFMTLTLAHAAYAQNMKCMRGDCPCQTDAENFCKDVQRGQGALMKCLKEHLDEISPGCKEWVSQAKNKPRMIQEFCKGDHEKFCKNARGRGAMLKCLKENENKLSDECKTSIK